MNTPQDERNLTGDLSSLPSRDRWLWNEDVYALDQLISMDPSGPYASTFADIIADRRVLLERELAERVFLTEIIRTEVHHQLRAVSELQRGDGFAIEQWVPALRCWIVCGRFPNSTPAGEVVRQLRAGDPRFKTPAEAFAEAQELAAKTRLALDRAGDEKVLAAVDSLSTRALETMIEVEGALKTGETIVAHGDDLAFIEKGVDRTRKAAAAGESLAQSVLTGGLRDTAACLNPGDNPNVR